MDAGAVADSNSFDVSGTSVALLQGFLNTTAVVSIDEAIETLRNYCPGCSPQVALDTLVANKWEVAQIVIVGFANEDYKCAIRIFTAEEPFPFYKWINAAFFSKSRSPFSLRFHGPYVKLLLLAVQELMSLPSFAYEGVGYRGLKLDGNAELKRKYLDYKTEFVVGQLMTFPAFMSVSTDDSVADDFGDYVFFVFVKVRGARIAPLSQLPKEAEIVVAPPSVFRIKAVAKVGTTKSVVGGHEVKTGGRLTITLEQESCPLTYLSQSTSKSTATSPPAAVSLPPAAATEDPKVLALSKALEALDVASAASCLKFAKALEEQGILTMERLKKLPEADAREALEAAGMKKLQICSVMEAIAPPPTVPPISPAAAPPVSSALTAASATPHTLAAAPAAAAPAAAAPAAAAPKPSQSSSFAAAEKFFSAALATPAASAPAGAAAASKSLQSPMLASRMLSFDSGRVMKEQDGSAVIIKAVAKKDDAAIVAEAKAAALAKEAAADKGAAEANKADNAAGNLGSTSNYFEGVGITGATGTNARVINGFYRHYGRFSGGHPLYQVSGHHDSCIELFEGKWQVKPRTHLGTGACWAFYAAVCALELCTGMWEVYDGKAWVQSHIDIVPEHDWPYCDPGN